MRTEEQRLKFGQRIQRCYGCFVAFYLKDMWLGEARRLIQLGAQIDRFISRNRLDARSSSDWSQIRQDLRLIADAYGFSINGNDGSYRRDDDDNRNRRRDDNVSWWQRLPRQ
jgi:hypothetical protein